MLTYLCLTRFLSIMLLLVAYASELLFMVASNRADCAGHRFPCFGSVQHDREHACLSLADQPWIKTLFSNILGACSCRLPHRKPNDRLIA